MKHKHSHTSLEIDASLEQKKAIHPIRSSIYSTMLIITGFVISRILDNHTTISEILHDIFVVSPLLILVVAMYLLTIKITKDI